MTKPTILSEEELQDGLRTLPGWEIRDGRIRKQFVFRTFLRAIAFANSVAYIAESSGHHPGIIINYNKVTLRLKTHSEDALTNLDLALAEEIEGKLSTKLVIPPEAQTPSR